MLISYDLAIVGAGASGLMVASKYQNLNIAIIESNSKIARKIKISGGGRCNVTNSSVTANNYLGDASFISPILANFTQSDLLDFLNTNGCFPKIRKSGQYFCIRSSEEVIDILTKQTDKATFFLNTIVKEVTKDDEFIIKTDKQEIRAKKLVVASGGVSYPKIGASDIGLKIAKSFGHSINTKSPALVGFTLQPEQFWMKELSGISLKVIIKVSGQQFCQDLLFAHKGISGPAILKASLYWQKGSLEIDFLANEKLKKYLNGSNKLISTVLPLPKRLIKAFLNSMNLEDKKVNELNEDDKQKLSLLKSYIFSPAGNFGYSKAEVMRGGIDTDEIDCETMMSKLVKDLYFVGECLDVTGELGGYNLQWAFSSGVRVEL